LKHKTKERAFSLVEQQVKITIMRMNLLPADMGN